MSSDTTVEARSANERMALLLGWEWHEPEVRDTPTRSLETSEIGATVRTRLGGYWQLGDSPDGSWDLPDYSSWSRFPELQEYVRGLSKDYQLFMENAVIDSGATFWNVTPTILRDAILAVVEDQEAG